MGTKRYLLLIVADDAVILDDKVPACRPLTSLCQQLLEHKTADHASHREALVHCWMEGVKFDIPVPYRIYQNVTLRLHVVQMHMTQGCTLISK